MLAFGQTRVAAGLLTVAAFVGPVFAKYALDELPQSQTQDLAQRVPGCRATVVFGEGQRIAFIAAGAWMALRLEGRPLELSVLQRSASGARTTVLFGTVDGSGNRTQAELSGKGSGRRCSLSTDCIEIPAQLTVSRLRPGQKGEPVFQHDVAVLDECGADRGAAVFTTPAWWEKFLRLLSI